MGAVSVLKAMFPSGSFVSFREFLSQDQVQGRSLDDLARSLSGDSQSICFYGYFSSSTNMCISQVPPPYQSVLGHMDLLESNSLLHSSFGMTQVISHFSGSSASYRVNAQKISFPRPLLISMCYFPLTGEAIC